MNRNQRLLQFRELKSLIATDSEIITEEKNNAIDEIKNDYEHDHQDVHQEYTEQEINTWSPRRNMASN